MTPMLIIFDGEPTKLFLENFPFHKILRICQPMIRKLTNYLIVGPPGSGKGTYGALLSAVIKSDLITASTILSTDREFKANYVDAGVLGPDYVVSATVGDYVNRNYGFGREEKPGHCSTKHARRKFILDGFPRTLGQLTAVQDVWPKKFGVTVDSLIVIDLPNWVCEAKLGGRVNCKVCKASYNTAGIDRDGYAMPPVEPKKYLHGNNCSCCGGGGGVAKWGGVRRHDDVDKEIIDRRLSDYREKTEAVVSAFRGEVVVFEPKMGLEDFGKLTSSMNI